MKLFDEYELQRFYSRWKRSSVVVPKSAMLWSIPGADFGTTSHT